METKEIQKKIKKEVDNQQTINHLKSLFGSNEFEEFKDWVYYNFVRLKMDGGYEFYNTFGLMEDVYTMFLLDVYKWSDAQEINKEL
jgi:hypothetical protein